MQYFTEDDIKDVNTLSRVFQEKLEPFKLAVQDQLDEVDAELHAAIVPAKEIFDEATMDVRRKHEKEQQPLWLAARKQIESNRLKADAFVKKMAKKCDHVTALFEKQNGRIMKKFELETKPEQAAYDEAIAPFKEKHAADVAELEVELQQKIEPITAEYQKLLRDLDGFKLNK